MNGRQNRQNKVLIWIAENPLIAKIFNEKDGNFSLLTNLLEAVNSNLKKALGRTLYEKVPVNYEEVVDPSFMRMVSLKYLHKEPMGKIYTDSFMETAIDSNEEALDWAHSFFSEECYSKTPKEEEACILQDWYCKFGLNEHEWDDLLDYKEFEDIIDDILEDYDISGYKPSWWDRAKLDEDEAEDLWGNQAEDLCEKTLVKK